MNNYKDEMFAKAHEILPPAERIDREFPDKSIAQPSTVPVLQHEDYELEVWMSTDGKHTVRGKATSPEGKKLMYGAVVSIFDQIKARYGTKQELNTKVYDAPAKTSDSQEPCKHQRTKKMLVRKDGPNSGREFLSCLDCKKFVSWV